MFGLFQPSTTIGELRSLIASHEKKMMESFLALHKKLTSCEEKGNVNGSKLDIIMQLLGANTKHPHATASANSRETLFRSGRSVKTLVEASNNVLAVSRENNALHCSICVKELDPSTHVNVAAGAKVKGVFKYDFGMGESFGDNYVLPLPFKDMRRSVRAHFASQFHAKQVEKRKLLDAVAAGDFRARKTSSGNVLRTAYTVLKKSLPYATFEDLVVLQSNNGVKVGNINHSRMLIPPLRSEFCSLMRTRLMKFVQEQPCIALVADKVTVANRTVDITAILAVVGNAPPENRIQSFVISAPVVAAHDGQSIARELTSSLKSIGVVSPDQLSAMSMDGQYHQTGVPMAVIRNMAADSGVQRYPVVVLWDGSHLLNLADCDARKEPANQWVDETIARMTAIAKRHTHGKGLEDLLNTADRVGSTVLKPKLWSATRFAPYASRTFDTFLKNWNVMKQVLADRVAGGTSDEAARNDLSWLSDERSKVSVSALKDVYNVVAAGSAALQDTQLLPWERKAGHDSMTLRLDLMSESLSELGIGTEEGLEGDFHEKWPALSSNSENSVSRCAPKIAGFVDSMSSHCDRRTRGVKAGGHDVGATNKLVNISMPGLKKLGDLRSVRQSHSACLSSLLGHIRELERSKLIPKSAADQCTLDSIQAARVVMLDLPAKSNSQEYSNQELYGALWRQAVDTPALRGYLDLVTRIWLLSPPESVVESMGSVISDIFGEHRQLSHLSAEEELQIRWNGPSPHHAEPLISAHQKAFPRNFQTSRGPLFESTVLKRFAREKAYRTMFK